MGVGVWVAVAEVAVAPAVVVASVFADRWEDWILLALVSS